MDALKTPVTGAAGSIEVTASGSAEGEWNTTRSGHARVLFAINSLEGGGAERVFTVVLDHIQMHLPHVEIEVVLLDDRPSRFQIQAPFKVHRLGSNGGFLDSAKRFYRFLETCRPDVVVSFLTRANYLTAAFSRPLGYKAIISERSDTNGRLGGGIAGSLKKALVRWLYPKAAQIIAVADGIKESLILEYGVARNAVRVIYNPYDMDGLRQCAAEPCDDTGVPFILSVGRLVRAKRFDLLIRAYAQWGGGSNLVILGEGPELAGLQALAEALGVKDKVKFPGFLKNPYPMMARASMFVLSSEREGFPNALVEAMCLGRPVIATNCCHGPAEILDMAGQASVQGLHLGQFGILVPCEDASAMAKAIERLQTDAGLAEHYARAAKVRAEQFSVEATVGQFAQLIKSEMQVLG